MAMKENTGLVTMKGNPLTLLGTQIAVGDHAPDFRVVDAAFKPVRLADFAGKVLLISAVPSLDTGVCSTSTQRFNKEAANLPADVKVITISMDLPFAQARFCEANDVHRIPVYSDHVWHEFGANYGILIKDMGLLSRAVWVIGRDGRVVYKELVPELTHYPNYDAALAAVKAELARPAK